MGEPEKNHQSKAEEAAELAAAAAVSAALAELAKKIFRRQHSSETHSPGFSSHSPSPSSSHAWTDVCTIVDARISVSEAISGTFRYYLLKWYEEVVVIPASTKDGTIMHLPNRGEPVDPADRFNPGRKDLLVAVQVR